MITSPDNPRFKELKRLTTRKYRRRLNKFLVDDPKTIQEGIQAGCPPESIYACRPDTADQFPDAVPVAEQLLASLSDQPSFSGVMAVFPVPAIPTELPLDAGLILEDIQDPANLGTICRSAALFGIQTIWVTPGCADPYALKTVRIAKGALFRLNVVRNTLEEILAILDAHGVPIVAADTRNGVPLEELPLSGRLALALGSEGRGITDQLRNACSQTVTIRTTGALESLNVAAAAAILLHHRYNRQCPNR